MLILLPCKLGLAAFPMIRDSDENNALIADKNLMNYSSSSLEYSEMLWKEKERETISEPFMVIHLGNYLGAHNLMLMAGFFFPSVIVRWYSSILSPCKMGWDLLWNSLATQPVRWVMSNKDQEIFWERYGASQKLNFFLTGCYRAKS